MRGATFCLSAVATLTSKTSQGSSTGSLVLFLLFILESGWKQYSSTAMCCPALSKLPGKKFKNHCTRPEHNSVWKKKPQLSFTSYLLWGTKQKKKKVKSETRNILAFTQSHEKENCNCPPHPRALRAPKQPVRESYHELHWLHTDPSCCNVCLICSGTHEVVGRTRKSR